MASSRPQSPRVVPCQAFNQAECLAQDCKLSHKPDSFSLGDGGRNVCLLYLMNRCDGYGCYYSHNKMDLGYTDEEIQQCIHEKIRVIHFYLSRFQISFAPPVQVPFMPNILQNPYPTPIESNASVSSSVKEDPVAESSEPSYSPPVSVKEIEPIVESQQVETSVPIANPEHLESEDQVQKEDAPVSEDEPRQSQLNPYAAAFFPLNFVAKQEHSIDNAYFDPAASIELGQDIVDEPTGPEQEEAQNKEEACATPEEAPFHWTPPATTRGWDDPPSEADWGEPSTNNDAAWDQAPAGETNAAANVAPVEETSAALSGWDVPVGGWDAQPSLDDWKTPPKSTLSLDELTSAQPIELPRSQEPFQLKEPPKKAKNEKPIEPKAAKSENKSAAKSQPNFKKTSTTTPKPKSKKGAKNTKAGSSGAVVVLDEVVVGGPSDNFRPDRPPHLLGVTASDQPRGKLSIGIGCIMPTPEKEAEIINASRMLVLENKSYNKHKASQYLTEGDKQTDWVNGKKTDRRADRPRDFSQRSQGTSNVEWGTCSRWPKPGN